MFKRIGTLLQASIKKKKPNTIPSFILFKHEKHYSHSIVAGGFELIS